MEHFRAKWTRFDWEARQLSWIGTNITARNSPAAIGARLCRNRKVKSARSLSYSPADGKAPRHGKPRRPRRVPDGPRPGLVAKSLHLTNYFLILHCNSAEIASAVRAVETSNDGSSLNVDEAGPGTHGAGRQAALTGCPWHDVNEMLQAAGLRPARQRMALGWLLFGKGVRHLTAEMLYEEATHAKVPVSLATVYNTLNQLTDAGLLRQVSVDGTKTYFGTHPSAPHPLSLQKNQETVHTPGRNADTPPSSLPH